VSHVLARQDYFSSEMVGRLFALVKYMSSGDGVTALRKRSYKRVPKSEMGTSTGNDEREQSSCLLEEGR
jgi:hypothetical protein